MEATSSNNITVKIKPWDDKGFYISYLHIWEAVGGKIPGGQVELLHSASQGALDFITNQQTGRIEIKDEKEEGLSYSFSIFITNRHYLNNILTLDFIIVPGSNYEWGQVFYTKPDSNVFNNIRDAIKYTWKGGEDKDNVDTDIPDSLKIRRCNETGIDFLTRILYSWKYKSVFAYSWDGLIIRDLEKSTDKELKTGAGLWYQTKTIQFKYNKLYNYSTFNPWTDENKNDDTSVSISSTPQIDFTNDQPRYATSQISYNSYSICAPGYEVMEKNYFINTNFKGYSSISVVGQDMPKKWKLGDLVMYKRLDTAEKPIKPIKHVIVGNEFFFSQDGASMVGPNGYRLEWTLSLWSLEKLPVSQELKNNKENQ